MTEDELLKELEQKLTKEYKDTEAVVRQKIVYFTKEFDKENQLMQKKVKAGEIGKKEYQKWYKDQIITKKWSNKMAKEISKDITSANETASKIINNDTSEVFLFGCQEAKKELGEYFEFEVFDQKQLGKIVQDNQDLLPKSKVDIPKDRKWNEKRIRSALLQSAVKGESVQKLSKRLEVVVGMNKTSAIRNARTMMTASHNMGKLETGYEAEKLGISVRKKWVATFDDRTRASHRHLHGETVDINEEFSNGLMFPADPDGDPEEVYNCRCTIRYVRGERSAGMSKEDFEKNIQQIKDIKAENQKYNEREKRKRKNG